MHRTPRIVQKTLDFVVINKYSLLGLGFCIWSSRRFSKNMKDLEHNTQEKKLFDPVKAKAQIQVYKEIYNFDQDKDAPQRNDGSLRILKSASDADVADINKYFKDREGKGNTTEVAQQINDEMEQLKQEIDSLEEVTSGHQGFKFYRTVMTKDTFEDALIELREKEFDKKFRNDQEMLVGDGGKPKTVLWDKNQI